MAIEVGTKVEYKTVSLTHGTWGVAKGQIDRKKLDEALAKEGNEGWELIHLWPDIKLYQEKDGHLLVFKRLSAT